jgi:hypothetical protein
VSRFRISPITVYALLTAFVGIVSFCEALRKAGAPADGGLRFEVTLPEGPASKPRSGRLLVALSRSETEEPRFTIGRTGLDAPPVLARDVENLRPGDAALLDERCAIFPISGLKALPPGEYSIQAVLDTNIDLKAPAAPGNLYSKVRRVWLDPARGETLRLTLTQQEPEESQPADTEYVRFVKIRSELLSRFHHRPIHLRAGVILPRDYAREPGRKYPLRVSIGGFGSRYTDVLSMMQEGAEFRRSWLAADTPRMILVHLDGAGPYGDCYQVNSANNGPYGDAITQELIPRVEQRFRALGKPEARFLEGGSTGGWVALALQILYPDDFNGAWAFYPDSVDFRAFQLIDIYRDRNAYVNRYGFERPAKRDVDGDVVYTVRHECQMENVLGRGDSYTLSGGQWGAWNAVYSPRGPDGHPAPLWNPKTGEIDRRVAEYWKRYDLRRILSENWKTLGPKLRGKIRVWVGEADDFYLNNAVHLLEDTLRNADPPFEGTIVFGPHQGHGWTPLTQKQLMQEMEKALRRETAEK